VSRRLLIALLAGVPLLLLVIGVVWTTRSPALPGTLPPPRNPALPDLAMSPLTEISASEVVEGGERLVAFTATIANVGFGPLRVHAVRADERAKWRVSQRFDEADGSLSETVTDGTMVWGGHGHDHWHVELGTSYWLTRPESTERLRRFPKVGYCFFDQGRLRNPPPTASTTRRFPKNGCSRRDALEVEMGLTPGWADPYQWTLPDQQILVTGLADGVYRLWADADPGDWFREGNEENNVTWVDLRLTTSSSPPRVAVLRRGVAGASAVVIR